MAKGDAFNSMIGEGSAFEGKFFIQGSLQIDGKFDGAITTEDTISIGQTGKVKTNITARKAMVAGTVIGNIKAHDEVVLQETGRVLGDITTPNLVLQRGTVLLGKVNVTGGQKKDVKKIIEDAYSGGPFIPGARGSGISVSPSIDAKLKKK